MIKRILIANRGEIAVRIQKTAHRLGIETIAIYTTQEELTLHTEESTYKVLLKGETLQETYLNIEQIINIAQQYQADAIHPGYGFLSENALFAKACEKANIHFIGPSSTAIQLMGNKTQANAIALKNNIPLLKKVNGTTDEMITQAKSLRLPVVIKAAMGGGGKGMRVVRSFDELQNEILRAGEEALRYFGDDTVYLEEYIENPRHIEVQILADSHGNTLHLFERECSIQRRHQKIIEEAPAINLNQGTRKKLYADAIKLAQSIHYQNAGTVEFLVTEDGQHYFLEMNTRIQVEHPVTEEITGIDIVEQQIRIAEGKTLSFSQEDLQIKNHAIEVRIYAENPMENFTPSFGTILSSHIPYQKNIRIDSGCQKNEMLNPNFDPLLKKIIATGNTRQEAIDYLRRFLEEYTLFGVETNREYIIQITKDEDFINGEISTSFCKTKQESLLKAPYRSDFETDLLLGAYWITKHLKNPAANSIWDKMGYWRQYAVNQIIIDEEALTTSLIEYSNHEIIFKSPNNPCLKVSSIQVEQSAINFIIHNKFVHVFFFKGDNGHFYYQHKGVKHLIIDKPTIIKKQEYNDGNNEKELKAPIPGKIIDIMVHNGHQVKKGDVLMVLEAMKTENNLIAWKDTIIENIVVEKGQQVQLQQLLLETK